VIELAQLTGIDQLLGRARLVGEYQAQLHMQHAAMAPRRGDHAQRVVVGAGQRLLAVDMLAGRERGQRGGQVEVVVQADVDGIHIVTRHQLVVAGMGVGDGKLGGGGPGAGAIQAGAGDHGRSRDVAVAADMRASDDAAADDADADGIGHGCSPVHSLASTPVNRNLRLRSLPGAAAGVRSPEDGRGSADEP
jgi:hypothetical protein